MNHNWVSDRIYMLYCDAQYAEVDDVVCISSTPEARLIAAEELSLVVSFAYKHLKPQLAKAICLLATGNAVSHRDAAQQSGITEVQLHRAIKWLKEQLESLASA